MPDYRFPAPGTDARFPGGGVDVESPGAGVDGRFNPPGTDKRHQGGYGSVVNSAPVNTGLPVITGGAPVGNVLSVTNGTWTGVPSPTFAYQWKKNGVNISGATSSAYTTVSGDIGATITCTVTATNSQGSASATATGVVVTAAPLAPSNTVAPVISGSANIGATLTATTGTWNGYPAPTYAYQWKSDGVFVGTNSSSYVVQASDNGKSITCTVTATNASGSASATSNVLGPVSGVYLVAPVLNWDDETSDATPDFVVTLTDAQVGDVLTLEWDDNSSFTSPSSATNTLSDIEAAGLSAAFATGALAAGTYYFRCKQARGASESAWSNTETVTISLNISSFLVMDATALDPSAVADAGLGVGIDGNGWIAKITTPWQAGQTFDPTKITFTVQDPGYDASGNPTTRTRTIKGRTLVRRQRPNAASKLSSQVGANLEAYFSLTDVIYAGSTILSIACASGYYGTAPAENSTFTNNSTKAYDKPLFAWLNIQHERATGSTFNVEAVAYHRHAMLGRQVACIQYIAKDTTLNVAATQTSSTPQLSSFQTQGNIVECYKASIPLTGLNQAELCQVNAKVYPWIGNSSAVLDLDTDGLAWPTPLPQTKLRFLNDKNGTYGGAIACVKSGASGGTVQSTIALARTTPFPTLNAAANALAAWNNTNKGHNNHSGSTIYLMDNSGAAQDHSLNGAITAAPGLCWTDVRPDPANTGAVRLVIGTNKDLTSMFRFFVNFYASNSWILSAATPASNIIALENITMDHGTGSSVPALYSQGITYARNCTWTGLSHSGLFPASPYAQEFMPYALILGNIINTGGSLTGTASFYTYIGNTSERVTLTESNVTTYPNRPTADGAVIANNKMLKQDGPAVVGAAANYPTGYAIVQNVFERSGSASTSAFEIGNGDFDIPKALIMYNTIPGTAVETRSLIAYGETAGSVGKKKHVQLLFNIIAQFNNKSDTFTSVSTVSGRVGNHSFRYHVGNLGNIAVTGSQGDDVPLNDGVSTRWLGECWDEVGTYGTDASPIAITYTSNQAGGVGSAGGGTYSLTGAGNPAYNRVPSGLAGLAFDIAGVARKNDGTGAAGAYERTV
jgi:hypothetical protein